MYVAGSVSHIFTVANHNWIVYESHHSSLYSLLVINIADDNAFTGTIPSYIGLMTRLFYLNLRKWE